MTNNKKKVILCNRCKRELDWEEKEMIKGMSREGLIQLIFAYQDALKKGEPIIK